MTFSIELSTFYVPEIKMSFPNHLLLEISYRQSYLIVVSILLVNFRTADAEASHRLTAIYAELEAIDSDSAPSRAAVILAGLGFSKDMQARPTKSFSGGWRMRLALGTKSLYEF